MSDNLPANQISSRWIIDFEKQIVRGKHVVLYGNVHDQFLWRGNYITATDFLTSFFVEDKKADVVVRYDPMDGFKFAAPHMEKVFDELKSRRFAEINPGLSGQDGSVPTLMTSVVDDPTAPPRRRSPGAIMGNVTQRIPSEDAFSRLRLVLTQKETSVVAVVDLADMLTSDPSRYTEPERNILMLLKKCTLEASIVNKGAYAGYRNTIVITAGELKRVPEWFYRDNPFISIVQCARPNRDERRQFAMTFIRPACDRLGFFGGQDVNTEQTGQNGSSEMTDLSEEFADLTDGFQAWDLEALRRTSWAEHISVKDPRKLIDFFKFGLRDDPWEKLNSEKVKGAADILAKRVIGQPRAVEAVTTMLTSARVGLSITGNSAIGGRPKGVFFFVGPTGVGKTELAKAVTELVFGDERAFARFDMSEYTEEHSALKLVGGPPSYVGYEEGGQLTNRVKEHPHSILLFDEIEKAHPRVLDKFLQILEDGRLTDGKGQTAYFNQTAIIFTSNIGASDLTDSRGDVVRKGIMRKISLDNVGDFPYEDIARHFKNEVEWYFTSRIGRAELLNRLGDNIVAFDILRPEHVVGIARKFLRLLAANAQEKYRLALSFHDSVLEHLNTSMREGDNLLYGGRRVKTILEGCIERPLNRWVFENLPDPESMAGTTITLGIKEGVLEVYHV